MKNTDIYSKRDGALPSLWQSDEPQNSFSQPLGTDVYDVLIVGAGLTGLTTALLLQEIGLKCAVAEAHTIGFGTTGGTSAHLNTFFDATYPEIESDFGQEAAKKVASAGKEAMKMIHELASRYQIDCDLETQPGYLFSENEKQAKQLSEIIEASSRAGISVSEVSTTNVPVPFLTAARFEDQGQFHPVKYIRGLADAFTSAGGVILEHTHILKNSREDGVHVCETDSGKLKGRYLVYATHMPPGINMLDFECAPYRSYVLGVSLADGAYPEGLAYDMQEPYHYFRSHSIDGKTYLIIGGEDHKTGHGDPGNALQSLEDYTRKYFTVKEVVFRWSSQYYIPADGLPYIGHLPGADEGIFIATGFNGNGMMFGTLSAIIISDLIKGKHNEYASLFSPSRIKPVAGYPDFVKENADVAWHFIADRFSGSREDLADIHTGEGKIIDIKGRKLAVYLDVENNIHALDPVCTHARCIVNFNSQEKSWDCPCHGGRFSIDGSVLTGPPRRPLKKINIDKDGE